MASSDNDAILQGSVDISKRLLSFADSMTLKCAVELRIADAIHSHGGPISLSQIAASIPDYSPSLNIGYLQRVMRTLVSLNIFTTTTTTSSQSGSGDTDTVLLLYGLTPSSMVLLHDSEISLAPLVLMQNHPLLLSTWQYLGACIREGGTGFKKAHGCELFEMASVNPELNAIFNKAMQCTAKIFAKAIISAYRDSFRSIETLVDVGGGVGHLIAEIVNEFPRIKGINFDLPHVVATAPAYTGVSHVAGDMFDIISTTGDAIFLKNILHDWGDEDCIKLLQNCRKAISIKTGKVVIVDIVLSADGEGQHGNLDLIIDLLMMANCPEGKERTELEWKKILAEGGFPRYKIIKLPFICSLIEAYPQ